MADSYFVILGSEDGGCCVEKMTKQEILEGMCPYDDPREKGMRRFGDRKILPELPGDICDFSDMVIIKGEIVVPEPKTVTTTFELP